MTEQANSNAADNERFLRPPELTLVVPTFNEGNNIAEVVKQVESALAGVAWELIFVDDDSPDGTADRVRGLAQNDARVRCLQRVGRRGLSSACLEGMLASCAPYVGVMDADLQHDPALLPRMLTALRQNLLDVVIGSRYQAGGSTGRWDSDRLRMSRFATTLARHVLKFELTDPMSGFFLLRREVVQSAVHNTSGIGFKILLDLFASAPKPLRFLELPYRFRPRQQGESKLDEMVAWEYLMLLLDKSIGRLAPIRFISFSLIGGLGVGVHMLALSLFFKAWGWGFMSSQAVAALVAMTGNFLLNNLLTYRDRRLHGWRLIRGWVSFVAACGIGALANVGIAHYLFEQDTSWALSALAGIAVGAVWNYAITAIYTWRNR